MFSIKIVSRSSLGAGTDEESKLKAAINEKMKVSILKITIFALRATFFPLIRAFLTLLTITQTLNMINAEQIRKRTGTCEKKDNIIASVTPEYYAQNGPRARV